MNWTVPGDTFRPFVFTIEETSLLHVYVKLGVIQAMSQTVLMEDCSVLSFHTTTQYNTQKAVNDFLANGHMAITM